jgi:hypothetical protein
MIVEKRLFTLSVLDQLLSGMENLSSTHITQHPNGFICIALEKLRRESNQLRIHLWNRHSFDADIHNHAWSFDSICLFGGLRMTKYKIDKSGHEFDRYVCKSVGNKNGREFVLRRVGVEGLIKSDFQTIRRGDQYEMNSSDLHQIAPLDSSPGEICAITIIRRGPYLRSDTDVYRSLNKTAAERDLNPERIISHDEISSELKLVRNELRRFVDERRMFLQ